MPESSTKNRAKKIGLPPGSIMYTGENPQHKINIELLAYNDSVIKRELLDKDSDLSVLTEDFKGVRWINVNGIHDIGLVKEIGKLFNLDGLVMEDVVNSTQRAKVEEREDYLFIVLKTLNINLISKDISYEQMSFIVGENFLLTFQETPEDVLDSVRTRIESPNYKMRKRSVGYLTYAILDSIVDNYFIILDEVEIEIDRLESKVINNSDKDDLQTIIGLKQKVSTLKRTIGPIRELITRLQTKTISEYLNEDMTIYLSDLADHGIIVYDTLEVLNTRVTELVQLYNSTISNAMNEIMKILAIISTIFMPLSFLTSLYGMNFDNMPELHMRYGYYALWVFMIALVLAMLAYFKNKKWL